jgi:hypothetical protein
VARARVRQQWNSTVFVKMMREPQGGVARDMLRRGLNVETRAKQALSEPPRRIDTGRGRASIGTTQIYRNGVPGARVGTTVYYMLYVQTGTGVFGPRRRRIRPTRAQFLRFKPKGSNRYVYARSVAGMKPNPFLTRGLRAAKD